MGTQNQALDIAGQEFESYNNTNTSSGHTDAWRSFAWNDTGGDHSVTQALISFETYKIFEMAFNLFLSGAFGLLGIVTNLITIVIFIRQGFQDSVNISLLGLAIADMCCVTTMVWSWVCTLIMLFKPPDFLFHNVSLLMMTANFPRLIATRLTCWMTALISAQRCLCVIIPFKVKFIFTPRNTSAMTVGIFLTVLPLYGLQMYKDRSFVLVFNPMLNRSQYFMKVEEDDSNFTTILRSLCYTLLPLVNLFIVILCAVVLVIRLNVSSQWRKDARLASSSETATKSPHERHERSKELSTVVEETGKIQTRVSKEQKITKMILTITVLFIICNTPSNILQTVSLFVPEFYNRGKHQLLFYLTNMIAFFMETVNSSVNLFVYYSLSTKFKAEVSQIFKLLPNLKRNKD